MNLYTATHYHPLKIFVFRNAQKILGNKDCENLINHPQLLQEILYTVVDVPRPLLKAEES